jgi:hypothetical protein
VIPAKLNTQNASNTTTKIKVKAGAKNVKGFASKNFEAIFNNTIPVFIFLKVHANTQNRMKHNIHIIIAGTSALI